MATKPYPQKEETSCVVNEPVVAYGKTASCTPLYEPTSYEMESIMKSKEEFKQGLFYTQEEVDKMVEEWLSPHTMEEIQAICDEAEADDEADTLLSSDFVHAEMERLNPWLCK